MDKQVHMEDYQSSKWLNTIEDGSFPHSQLQMNNDDRENSGLFRHQNNQQNQEVLQQPEAVSEDFDMFGVDLNPNDTYLDQGMFNMPGAFKPDPMDLDESPPFTIDLQFGVDTYETPNFALTKPQAEPDVVQQPPQLKPEHPQSSMEQPSQDWQQQLLQEQNSQDNIIIQEEQQSLNDQLQSDQLKSDQNYLHPNNLKFHNQQELSPYDASTMHSEAHHISYNPNDHLRKGSIDSYYNQNPMYQNYQSMNSFSTGSLMAQNNIINNQIHLEMSPLTTTTSLTPSVNSMHSTQPSFFSAHQYFSRNSIDHTTNQPLHGGHLDMYSSRPSIDSQKPGRPGRFNTFSISNMIPFMNDRNQQQPVSPPSPSSYLNNQQEQQQLSQTPPKSQPPQSKGLLLRSIFKSSNDTNGNSNLKQNQVQLTESDFQKDYNNFMVTSPTKEEPEFDTMDYTPAKKSKKPKRSIFNRFKTPVKDEELSQDDALKAAINNLSNSGNLSDLTDRSNTNVLDNSSFDNANGGVQPGPQYNTTNNSSGSNVLAHDTSNTSLNNVTENGDLDAMYLNTSNQEPNYGALFENVGKRKNIVNRKTKPKIKSEPHSDGSYQNSIANTERSSQLISTKSKGDGISVSSSNASSSLYRQMSENSQSHTYDEDSMSPDTPNADSSTFVSASKRILGSKLSLKRKTLAKEPAVSNGEEVEVDLSSLDLPPDTQIFPTSIINSKNRTRGRKENKQADMVDTTKIYLCNYCSRRFKRQEHLKRHFRSLHTFEKPYECNLCHKKFSRSDNLNQHLKIHKQEEEAAAAAAATEGVKIEADD